MKPSLYLLALAATLSPVFGSAAHASIITFSDRGTGDVNIASGYAPTNVASDPTGAGSALPSGITATWSSGLASSDSAPDHTPNNPNSTTPPNRYMFLNSTGTTSIAFSADVIVSSLFLRPDGNPAGSIGIRGLDASNNIIWSTTSASLTNVVWNEVTNGASLTIRKLEFFDGNGGSSGNPRFAGVDDITVLSASSTVATSYTLTTSQASTLNLLKGGSASAGDSVITNNGGAGKDTLNFTNLSASSNNANASVTGTLAAGGPLANSNGSASQALTVTGNAYGSSTITSTVDTATNATLGGSATQSGASGSFSVNVGSATVGGPALTAAVSASGSLAGLASRTIQGESAALGNEAEIADGTNSAGTDTVSMQWRLRTAPETYPNNPPVLSDVVNLTGITPGDLFVLKIYYKTSDIPVAINESTLALGWNDIGVDGWENAVLGNSDLGAFAQRLNGSWTIIGTLDPTDLGKYGVDTNDITYNGISYGGYVWAVLDHNSEFAVIPEPASLSLLALGTLTLATKRRRE